MSLFALPGDVSRIARQANRKNSSYGCYFCDRYVDDDEIVLDYWEEVRLTSKVYVWCCDWCKEDLEPDEEE